MYSSTLPSLLSVKLMPLVRSRPLVLPAAAMVALAELELALAELAAVNGQLEVLKGRRLVLETGAVALRAAYNAFRTFLRACMRNAKNVKTVCIP